jgi:O-succinylbenzoate synthase
MDIQNTSFVEIENYIRNLISKNNGIFDRDSIIMQSKEWMQKFPVEFNSMLNLIENEGKSDEMMDDSMPSVAFGGASYVDDSMPSVAFGGASYVDDSMPSVAFGGASYVDDSMPSVAFGGSHTGHFPVDYSPKADSMSSDYSPCGNPDDDDDCGPLQRTMSS